MNSVHAVVMIGTVDVVEIDIVGIIDTVNIFDIFKQFGTMLFEAISKT